MTTPKKRRARKVFRLGRLRRLLGLDKPSPAAEVEEPAVEKAPEPEVEVEEPASEVEESASEVEEPVVEKTPEPGLTLHNPASKEPQKSKSKK